MIELSRIVRFCVDFGEAIANEPPADWSATAGRNTFAGWPSMAGLGAFYQLEIRCRGEPDPLTGYLLNISVIDEAVRQHAIPLIQRAADQAPHSDPAALLQSLLSSLQGPLRSSLAAIRWHLSPYYSLAMTTRAPDRVLLSQQFEFSASHRLHVTQFSDQRNREIFGKCNNSNGHGHNYRLEVTVSRALDDPQAIALPALERIVNERIIQRFDHKHLNLDAPEFAQVNPSVENIAKVCFTLLTEPISLAGGLLRRVTVWETEKTSCTYPGDERGFD